MARSASSAPYAHITSSEDVLETIYGLARSRGVVVNYAKSGIKESFRRPEFPGSREDLAQLLSTLGRRKAGWPGVHLTHSEYASPPNSFGDPGERARTHFFLDLDGRRSLAPARTVASDMAGVLEGLGVPHWVSFSGRSGFHVHIPAAAFPTKVNGLPLPDAATDLFPRVKHLLIRQALSMHPRQVRECVIHPKRYYETTQGIQRLPLSRHESTGLYSLPIRDDGISAFDPRAALSIKPGTVDQLARLLSQSGSAEPLLSLADSESRRRAPRHSTR